VQSNQDVVDVIPSREGRHRNLCHRLVQPSVTGQEANPEQSSAEPERTHERPPPLSEIGGRMHRVGGGFQRRNGQQFAVSHPRIMSAETTSASELSTNIRVLWISG
jgi:hypothetical protein